MNGRLSNPALDAMRRSISGSLQIQTVAHVLARKALRAHFQPIVQLKDGKVLAHEALIRGPQDSPLQFPDALFAAAKKEGLGLELEVACLREEIRSWASQDLSTRLFLNLSANALVALVEDLSIDGALLVLREASVSPSSLTIEITEHEGVRDLPALTTVATKLRSHGIQFALDDFGDGRSSLRLWSELRPDVVKIDKYFVKNVNTDAIKVQTLRGLMRLAETFGTTMVAEGIETADELHVVRDLGIELGQGYLLGRPAPTPGQAMPAPAAAVFASSTVAVLPVLTRAPGADVTVERLASFVEPVSPTTTVDEVAARFAANESLRAIPVVFGGKAVGLLNRNLFLNQYSRAYFKELYGRKGCMLFANSSPVMLDKHTGLGALTAVLTSQDQRYLTEGFIVTEGGRYFGLGTGEQLVRVVTEVRIEAARHANPLTFLPGNIPISEHISRLIEGEGEFVAVYADLNDFKPYNDHYGYWRGDTMLKLLASTLAAHCDARRDFLGHVGGDDFVVLFQSDDWIDRCQQIIADFNEKAKTLFDEDARKRGGIEAEDRHGMMRFFHFTSLSIGAVRVRPGQFSRPEEVASAAASAKHRAKSTRGGLMIEDAEDLSTGR